MDVGWYQRVSDDGSNPLAEFVYINEPENDAYHWHCQLRAALEWFRDNEPKGDKNGQ